MDKKEFVFFEEEDGDLSKTTGFFEIKGSNNVVSRADGAVVCSIGSRVLRIEPGKGNDENAHSTKVLEGDPETAPGTYFNLYLEPNDTIIVNNGSIIKFVPHAK